MIAVREQDAAADVVVSFELVICDGELVEHREVERVALRRPVEAHQQDVAAALDRHLALLRVLDGAARFGQARSSYVSSGEKLADLIAICN